MRPIVGMEVCKVTRKHTLITGEVISVGDDGCGIYAWFVVEWGPGNRVEYNMRAWRHTVSPTVCSVCDSETHNVHPTE